MSTPPGEPNPSASPSQPLPHQPLQPTPPATFKPTHPPSKKPRHKKQADTEQKAQKLPQDSPTQTHLPPPPIVYSPNRGPVYQPYPGPPYIMNPGYPINGGPYSQQQHQPPYPPPPGQPIGPAGQGIPPPHPSQYAYSMHPPPYAHPGYSPYPQYAQPMVMYAPPRPGGPPDTPQSASPPAQPSITNKRKRKSLPEARGKNDRASDDDTGASSSDVGRVQTVQQQAQAQAIIDLKKRTKTQRACDSCRSRKIRCDILTETDPPVCQHCKQYGFDCTFFLPITETRFKKKKLEEEAAEKEKVDAAKAVSSPVVDAQPKRDIGIFGPTSAAHLLHSQASISSRIYEGYDLRYQHTFEVSKSGDGLIQVQKPAQEEQQQSHYKPVDLNIEPEIIEKLVNAFFNEIAPMLPVITKSEFLATPNPPPVLLYSICLVAAARRDVPQNIFDSIRYTVNGIIKAEDVLSTASITNVQALLILCMTGDCHSQFVPSALSALWIRLGNAIRMAQDLGLHRAESVKQNVELRRRLWGACLISDRWTSLAYGHPYMIDVQDCDARLPSSGDLNDLYMDELVRLSVILGRVLKTIYSPSGLSFTTDEMLYQLLEDIERWKAGLPDHLQFRGPDTPQNAGLLHFLYACVCMMFWRVFMRISYSCPTHLKFGLTVEQWSKLVTLTGEAIDWLDNHEQSYDVWLLVAYAATSCALVQYHTWARRKDAEAAAKLRKLRDCVRRWEGSISPDHMSVRRKTAEIISLLYEATQGPPLPMEAPALNPTGGVTAKQPIGLDYKKDPTRPGGGVFIVHGKARAREEDFKDVPAGTIITSTSSDEGSEGEPASPPTAIFSSAFAAPSTNNDRDRVLFSLSSSFAPPLPTDRSYPQQNSASTSYERAIVSPVSALRSPMGGRNLQQQQQHSGQGKSPAAGPSSPSFVNFPGNNSGLRGSYGNLNPAMNHQAQSTVGNVRVMNVLDAPQGALEDFVSADTGFLEGIPGGMFDWGQWETFFSRFSGGGPQGEAAVAAAAANMEAYQQQRLQQQQQPSPISQQSPMTHSPIPQQPESHQNLPARFAS